MIFESTLASIPRPDKNTLKAFRSNFFRKYGNEHLPLLEGHSSEIYDDPDDLVALHNSKPPDRLTMFVKNELGFLFKVSVFAKEKPQMVTMLMYMQWPRTKTAIA